MDTRNGIVPQTLCAGTVGKVIVFFTVLLSVLITVTTAVAELVTGSRLTT